MEATNEPGAKAPPPGDLRVVQLFVNSLDIEEGIEQFDSPRALSSWLFDHGLTTRRLALGERDMRPALPAMAGVLRGHGGGRLGDVELSGDPHAAVPVRKSCERPRAGLSITGVGCTAIWAPRS